MQIAPGIDSATWKSLRLDSPQATDWEAAIGIFERRIRERFLDAIDLLIVDDEYRPPLDRRFGFAILALDCLLIETLQAFREGLKITKGQSQRLAIDFLTSRPAFRPYFCSKELADAFYKDFRCGVVHNAQVFGSGLIWSVGPLLQVNDQQMTVNRTEFHACAKAEFHAYLDELRDPAKIELRSKFRDKMDFIAAS